MLGEEIQESENSVVKILDEYHATFIKFAEQRKEVESLKNQFEKSSTDYTSEQMKLDKITKEWVEPKVDGICEKWMVIS